MRALRMFLWMLVLTGLIYPLVVTAIATLTMSHSAKGSQVVRDNRIVGSLLIGQKFENGKYFSPRPSAVDFNTLPASGSNLGPTSAELKKTVDQRRAFWEGVHQTKEIPSELLFASGSGLDPHITLECAYFQMARVAKARQMESKEVKQLIDSLIQNRFLGFLGEKYVNVLELNLTLDKEKKWQRK